MESRKGKNASEEILTPFNRPIQSAFSASVSGSGASVNFSNHCARSSAVMVPSMYCTRALTRSWRLTSDLNGKFKTLGCCRSHHVCTFLPASLTQSTRDCWPAPTPIIIPDLAYPTELDWVYLAAMDASTKS